MTDVTTYHATRPTPAETAILQQLADGLTVAQIARREPCSGSTISMRIRRMAKRIGYADATTPRLVAIALRRGWIT